MTDAPDILTDLPPAEVIPPFAPLPEDRSLDGAALLTVEHAVAGEPRRFANCTAEFLASQGVPARVIAAAQRQAEQEAAVRAIDSRAGTVRARLLTSAAGQDLVYRMKADQARAYRKTAVADRERAEWPLLTPEALAREVSVDDLVSEILSADHAFAVAVGRIEAARFRGKRDVAAADTPAAVRAAREAAEAALNTLSQEL